MWTRALIYGLIGAVSAGAAEQLAGRKSRVAYSLTVVMTFSILNRLVIPRFDEWETCREMKRSKLFSVVLQVDRSSENVLCRMVHDEGGTTHEGGVKVGRKFYHERVTPLLKRYSSQATDASLLRMTNSIVETMQRIKESDP